MAGSIDNWSMLTAKLWSVSSLTDTIDSYNKQMNLFIYIYILVVLSIAVIGSIDNCNILTGKQTDIIDSKKKHVCQ